MEFWVMSEEMKKLIDDDRKRLLAYNDFEALKLTVSDQYQRNKYKGEIESHKWLMEERRKQAMRIPLAKEAKRKKADHFKYTRERSD